MSGSTPHLPFDPHLPSGPTLHLPFDPHGPAALAGDLVTLTPLTAGWTWAGLQVLRLAPGEIRRVATGPAEVFVLPLSGPVSVEVAPAADAERAEASFELAGRRSVFSRVSDFAYAGRDSVVRLVSRAGAEVALPSAVCEHRRPPRYGPAEQVPVEVRGAGPASRQVTNFGVPGVWEHAERLTACEVITPPGNWSSYPAHKHDVTAPCPVANEEIYFYRIAGADQVTPDRAGFGLHRTYTGPEHAAAGLATLDTLVEVRDLDVLLVPYGYHGPCVAAPGYPMYYLNVLAGAGAGADRSMAFCDDPTHTWVRSSWDGPPAAPPTPTGDLAPFGDLAQIGDLA
jgi:5-deoxy-glucuronate isomerase